MVQRRSASAADTSSAPTWFFALALSGPLALCRDVGSTRAIQISAAEPAFWRSNFNNNYTHPPRSPFMQHFELVARSRNEAPFAANSSLHRPGTKPRARAAPRRPAKCPLPSPSQWTCLTGAGPRLPKKGHLALQDSPLPLCMQSLHTAANPTEYALHTGGGRVMCERVVRAEGWSYLQIVHPTCGVRDASRNAPTHLPCPTSPPHHTHYRHDSRTLHHRTPTATLS